MSAGCWRVITGPSSVGHWRRRVRWGTPPVGHWRARSVARPMAERVVVLVPATFARCGSVRRARARRGVVAVAT